MRHTHVDFAREALVPGADPNPEAAELTIAGAYRIRNSAMDYVRHTLSFLFQTLVDVGYTPDEVSEFMEDTLYCIHEVHND